jgi:hypothetical protein
MSKSMVVKKLKQQGDVLFFSEEKMPTGLKPVQPKFNRWIFAEGEATGHHHSVALEDNVVLMEDENGTLWCKVDQEEVTVTHQEHGPVTLKQGVYRIGIVREVDPFAEEIHKVRD